MVDNRITQGLEDPAQLLQVIDRIVMLFSQVFRLRREKAVVEQIVATSLTSIETSLSASSAYPELLEPESAAGNPFLLFGDLIIAIRGL